MQDRPRIQRALLRRAMRKQMRTHVRRGEQLQVEMFQLALDDEAVFETVYDSSMKDAEAFGNGSGMFTVSLDRTGQPVVDNLLKLLQWFVTNGPQLIEIIENIIGMFGGSNTANSICEDETMFVE